jgi:hypothetical protein
MSDRPIDIIKSAFLPRLWHKTPYLICILELKNETIIGRYLFPINAKLEIFREPVAFATPTLESPGSHRSGSWSTTHESGGINQANFYWKPERRQNLYCCFEISAIVLNSLGSMFDREENSPYRVDLELGMVEDQTMMVRRTSDGPITQETMPKLSEGISVFVEGQVKIHEWREWMKAWGVASEAIYLPAQLLTELRTIKPVMGVGFEWEVISELLKLNRGCKAEATLVTSGDELQLKMAELIQKATKELLIMCRALDETLLTQIAEAQGRGVEVKIIAVPTEKLKGEKYPEINRLAEAWRKVSIKTQVRENIKQHARIIISDMAVLVGSADPDYYGLKIHHNASIYTTNPTVINAARLFFDRVWQDSEG